MLKYVLLTVLKSVLNSERKYGYLNTYSSYRPTTPMTPKTANCIFLITKMNDFKNEDDFKNVQIPIWGSKIANTSYNTQNTPLIWVNQVSIVSIRRAIVRFGVHPPVCEKVF